MRPSALIPLVVLIATCVENSSALAIVQYHKEFVKTYIDPDATVETDLSKLMKDRKNRCLVCHQGKKKKNCNKYGEHFRPLLDRKKDKKDQEKIVAALKKVAKLRIDPENKESRTFGELLADGKLPGGTLEELKKEPIEKEPSEEVKPKE